MRQDIFHNTLKRYFKGLSLLFFGAFLLLNKNTPCLAEEKWQEHRSTHFIIYYKDAPPDFIQSVDETAEHLYQEITQNLGFYRDKSWTWDQRAIIYIYQDADDYVNSAKQAGWSHGAASTREKIIRSFPTAHGFVDSTLPHELGHIIFREFVGYSVDIPLWFDEGVAMYQEKAKRWGANKAVISAMEKNVFLSLDDLARLKLTPETERSTVDLFYAEAASIVYYMMTELGQYRFVHFCRQLKEGKNFEQALYDVYTRFKNVDDLNRAWTNYLKR